MLFDLFQHQDNCVDWLGYPGDGASLVSSGGGNKPESTQRLDDVIDGLAKLLARSEATGVIRELIDGIAESDNLSAVRLRTLLARAHRFDTSARGADVPESPTLTGLIGRFMAKLNKKFKHKN